MSTTREAILAALYANGRELHALANAHATPAELDAKLSIMRRLEQANMSQLSAKPSADAATRARFRITATPGPLAVAA